MSDSENDATTNRYCTQLESAFLIVDILPLSYDNYIFRAIPDGDKIVQWDQAPDKMIPFDDFEVLSN